MAINTKCKIPLAVLAVLISTLAVKAQEFRYRVFEDQPINFGGSPGNDKESVRLADGRLVYKKVTVPTFKEGTDVSLKIALRSAGDRWDKSGSCFVVADTTKISMLDIAEGREVFPPRKAGGHAGILPDANYEPVIELMRFMTPFGVGHYSDDQIAHRRPVYIPKWAEQVVWKQDISHLKDLVSGTFYIGVWVDTWTGEGYRLDLELWYSGRSRASPKVLPLINTIPYVGGQDIPDVFSKKTVDPSFTLVKPIKNARLHYIVTGHGGHSGGDEFSKKRNTVYVDDKMVIDTVPWRDDCASFRRFNPSSGVWLKKDTASFYEPNMQKTSIKLIEERIASSDLSRSNWCPGSSVEPMVVDIGNLEAGRHTVKISIPASPINGDKLNHWLVSAYLTYEEL